MGNFFQYERGVVLVRRARECVSFKAYPFQLEISDDEAIEQSGRHASVNLNEEASAVAVAEASNGGLGAGSVPTGGATGANLAEELDNLMDISMEIDSNKRMKRDHIKPFRLTFKDDEMEKQVCNRGKIGCAS